MTAYQELYEDVWCEREDAEREGLLHWPQVMPRDVVFFAQHRTNKNLDIRNSPHEITTLGQYPTEKDLLASIASSCNEFKDIDPSEWEFCLVSGFDGANPVEDGDFYDDYEPWVSEWQSFDFDYQLQRI